MFLSNLWSLSVWGQASWQQISQPIGPNFTEVEAMGDTIFATKNQISNLYRSTDNGKNWNPLPQAGIAYRLFKAGKWVVIDADAFSQTYRISEDRGETWQGLGFANYALFYPLEDSIYYVVESLKLYKYPNNSSLFTADPTKEIYDVAKRSNELYVLSRDGIFYSNNYGASWQQTIDADTSSALFSSSSSRLIASAHHLFLSKPGEALYRSDDNGATWEQVFPAPGSGIYWSEKRLQADGDTLFYAEENINASVDLGQSWQPRANIAGAKDLSFGENEWYVASPIGAFRSPDRGFTWYVANGLIEASEPPGVAGVASSGGHTYFSSTYGLFSTADGGKTFLLANNGYSSVAPVAVGDTVFYLTNLDFEMSVNGGKHFEKIPVPGQGCAGCIFVEMLGYQRNRLVAYKGISSNDNEIYKFNPATQIFQLWAQDIYNVHALHKDILLHYNPNIGMLQRIFWDGSSESVNPDLQPSWDVYGMWSAGNALFMATSANFARSVDDGATWQQINPPQPGISIYRIFGRGDRVVASTNVGLFFSKDRGATWEAFNEGFPGIFNQYYGLSLGGDHAYFNSEYQLYRRDFDNFFRINGLVYEDVNDNGVRDSGEPPALGALVASSPAAFAVRVDSMGRFWQFPVLEGDTLRAVPVSPYATVKPVFHRIETSDTAVQFGIYYVPDKRDLSATMVSLTPVRPGFSADFYLNCQNNGTATATGTVQVVVPPQLSYQSASPLPNFIAASGDTLTWQLDNIERFESQTIVIKAVCAASAFLGEIVCVKTSIETAVADANPDDNDGECCYTVVGSFDPNDKQSIPGERITTEQLADAVPMVYTIRFQNTGTYLAENVVVEDTLDVKNLNLASFKVLAASHPMTWTMENRGLVKFRFTDINLPDSTSNEPESHGFVQYIIQPKPDLTVGTGIRNTAYIYFDFNEPIVTNMTETVVSLPVKVGSLEQSMKLSLLPNPARTFVRISVKQGMPLGRVEILDASGQLQIAKSFGTPSTADIDIRNLPAGHYFIRAYSGRNIYSQIFEKINP